MPAEGANEVLIQGFYADGRHVQRHRVGGTSFLSKVRVESWDPRQRPNSWESASDLLKLPYLHRPIEELLALT